MGAIACQREAQERALTATSIAGVSRMAYRRAYRSAAYARAAGYGSGLYSSYGCPAYSLLGTLRNKLLCTLRHLQQQLRHSLRASEIRLRRTVRTDFLLRVPAAWSWSCAAASFSTPST